MALVKTNSKTNIWSVFNAAGTANQFWSRITSASYATNDQLRLEQTPIPNPSWSGLIELGANGNATWARQKDAVVLAKNAEFRVTLKGVEYISAAPGFTADLHQVGTEGFTTNGSIRSIEASTGNHTLVFENAYRDSELFLGKGIDTVVLSTNPDLADISKGVDRQDTYWITKRLGDNSIQSYSLFTGNVVHMVDGAVATYARVDTRGNYGEIEVIQYRDRNNSLVTKYPGNGDLPNNGSRGGFENIDLSQYNQDSYTDSFLHASFGSINFTSKNVFVGAAVIEDWFDNEARSQDEVQNQQSAALRWSTSSVADVHHNHDLYVAQQTDAIDGHLRVYVRDENSRVYNRFNEVYLGTSASEVVTRGGASTSGNGLTQSTTAVALYGFGGNDILTAGAGSDYLFGGTSTYTTIINGYIGNLLTGASGADYFGVGNISSGADGDVIMSSDFSTRLFGTAPISSDPSGTLMRVGGEENADLATRVATDRIADWTHGVDSLRVLANGTAVITGLGTSNGAGGSYTLDSIGSDAERIDLSGGLVNNEGKIVARGLDGVDTLVGSAGNDWLYGNAGSNLIVLNEGGSDRVFYDTFSGVTRALQYVSGFDIANDQFYLNKQVIDAFGGDNTRSWTSSNVPGIYTQAVKYSPSINYLHDVFYSPSLVSSNTTHDNEDGSSPSLLSGSDGKTFTIGVGMVAAGFALLFVPFAQGAGYALIASGTALGAGSTFVNTQEHRNATYSGDVGNYLNVITSDTLQTNGATVVASSTAFNDSNVSFLSFFGGSDAGDGYVPVVEFTANAGQGVYGYFALHSNTETFVYLVASRDNLVENGEAIKVAEINGLLYADDFKVYDGLSDVYNYGTIDPILLAAPTVTQVQDASVDVGFTSSGESDRLIDNISGAVSISITLDSAPSAGSSLVLYDGVTKIYDQGAGTPVNVNVTATYNPGTRTYTVTDNRPLGTVATQTDTNALTENNDFILRDSVVNYNVEMVDGVTGIPSRDSSGAITITGGQSTIDGGSGTDSLSITGTSDYLNGASNAQLIRIETIYINAKDTNGDGLITSADDSVIVDLSSQDDGFTIYGSTLGDVITGSIGDDTILGLGGQDTINLSAGGNDVVSYTYTDSLLGNDAAYDTVTGMTGATDAIYVAPSGLADTDNDGVTNNPVPGWTDKDGDNTRLMYETATPGTNKAVSSATELLVVSNSSVSTTGDLTNNIASALGSAFNLAGLDGTAPSASTGDGSDATSLFAVLSNETDKWWVGRYVDIGNDDTATGDQIEVFGLFETDDILNSFWLDTVLAPQPLGLSMPVDSGLSEGGTYTTNAAGFSVTGLQSGNSVYYSLNGGGSWVTGSPNLTSIALAEGTHNIQIRQVEALGNYSPLSEITSASNIVIIDRTNPTVSNLSKSGSTVGYAVYQAGLGDITLSWSLTETNNYDTIVEYKNSSSQVWISVGGVLNATGNQSVNLSDLDAGTYNWRVTHTDKAGNSSTTSGANFTLTPPDVTNPTYTTSSTFDANGYGYFAYVFSDSESGINLITINQADTEVRFQGNTTGGPANDGWYGEYNDGWLLVGNELRLYPRGFNSSNPAASGPAYDTWSGLDHRSLLNVVVRDNAGNELVLNDAFEFDAGDVGYFGTTWNAGDINDYLMGIPPNSIYL